METPRQAIRDFLLAVDRGYLGKMPSGFNDSAFTKALRAQAELATVSLVNRSVRAELTPAGDWYAIDDNTYDGAPDAGRSGVMGWGKTEQAAIDDLIEQLQE